MVMVVVYLDRSMKIYWKVKQRATLVDGFASTNAFDLEADVLKLLLVKNETTIKDKGGLVHRVVDLLPVKVLELVPLGSNDDTLGTDASFHGGLAD